LQNLAIKTDPFRLKQILINLIDNAFKFTENGFVEFGYRLKEKNTKIEFFIKDSGIGIAREKFEDIFQSFNKIETDKSKLYRGTGLGLTITKNLIERLGGKIWLESSVKVGSTFYVELPLNNSDKSTSIPKSK